MADSAAPLTAVFKQPWQTQLDYFQQKLNLPTEQWTDIMKAQHDRSFVVAGAMASDLLEDLRQAVGKAIAGGSTLADFRRDFDQIVATHGWDFKGGRNWRTRVIYQTNLQTSYAAGRYQQLTDPDMLKVRPYWRYVHSDSVLRPRPQHQAWNGLILRADDPWWNVHYPPNGWGCQCTVHAVSLQELRDKYGKDGPDTAPVIQTRRVEQDDGSVVYVPDGIDFGWDYAPGQAYVGKLLLDKAATTSARIGADAIQSAVNNIDALDKIIQERWQPLVQQIYPDPASYRPTKQRFHIGALSPQLVDKIEQATGDPLATAVVSVDDAEVKHALRDTGAKADKRIALDDAMQTVVGMWEPERVYQQIDHGKEEPVYLAVWQAADGSRHVKAAINVNYRTKDKDASGKRYTLQTNTLLTLGYVDLRDLDNPQLYKRIL
ncbi:phage virion morphogenesis protein [Aquitalea magnusonii]|uniref:Phage virion morphogenesis protein n=1 Tax=Aquitalea magnusonii TaxID=332411 RepID=A0A3G9GGE9_9NEIS|nr:phage minor head protein [Aquitalea magnusonii]BBF85709.1 phage virion morphogenesis protein [Aquitalea magnusonii]